ncbi:MAG: RagB/SusD family nutrient uptake outer membrane protein [Paludibacteraceae bacterium]
MKQNKFKTKITKYIVQFSVIFLFLAPVMYSCANLDEPLYSQLNSNNFLQTDEEILSAIGAVYSGVRAYQDFGNLWAVYCTADEVAIVGRTGGDWAGDGQDQQMTDHKWTNNNRFFNGTWLSFFGQVNKCNQLIYQLEQIDKERFASYIAEIRTVRAMWYMWLIDMWGNVPVIDKFDVPKGYLPATNSRKDVFNFIEKELKESMPNLSKDVNTNTYGRATYWMAQAILAKIYLNAEIYTGTPQLQKALDACDEIIDSKKFNLTATYRENFIAKNENSTEAIFAIPFDAIYTQWQWFLPLITLHGSSQKTFNMTNQPWNGLSVQTDFFYKFEDNDIRKKDNFIWGPQYTSSGEPLLDPGYEKDTAIDPDGPQIIFTPTFISLYSTARQSGARIGKWEIEIGGSGQMNNDFFMFRYSDIVLIKAEVLWRKDNSSKEALDLVNLFRTRAGVEKFESLTADNLLDERGRELFMEGWRRNDLIRFGKFDAPTIF